MIHHKSGQMNKGADALSRRYLLLSALETKVLGFEIVNEMYAQDKDLKEIFIKSSPSWSISCPRGIPFQGKPIMHTQMWL